MFTPNIPASKVAGLIGLNPYQNVREIMFDLMMKDSSLKVKLDDIIKANNRSSLAKMKRDILQDQDIAAIVGSAVRQTEGMRDIQSVLDDTETSARATLNFRHPTMTVAVREMMVNEIRGAVGRRRGNKNENAGLDTYAAVNEVVVQDRNTKTFKKSYDGFDLNGRPDGFVASLNRIVDTKERTRWWPKVPVYDEVQLRVYMELTGAQDSDLNEVFPDGRRRQTNYVNDPEKWQVLHNGIVSAVATMKDTIADPDSLRDLVFANTA